MSDVRMKGRRGGSKAAEDDDDRVLFGEPAPRMHELAEREKKEAALGGTAQPEMERRTSEPLIKRQEEPVWSDEWLFGEPAPRMHELAEREKQAAAARVESGPLPEVLREKFEQSLGQDLGDVEVQTGAQAAREAEALNAHAVTQGKKIRFAEGTYDPASAEGERLLAHEVAHTVQQERAGVAWAQGKRTVSEPGDAAEVEAEQAAADMVRGEAVQVSQAPEARSAKKPAEWAKAPANVLLEQALGVMDQALEALGQKKQGTEVEMAPAVERAQLVEALHQLEALQGGDEAAIRRAVLPILAAARGERVEELDLGEAETAESELSGTVQRSAAAVFASPLLGAGPPGWVLYAVAVVGSLVVGGVVLHEFARYRERARERAEPAAATRTKEEEPEHRGRLQVQGPGMNGKELSFPWARAQPMTKAEALLELALLQEACTSRQFRAREKAFDKARDCILRTLYRAPPDFKKSFSTDDDERVRVDIEIRKGVAFV